MEKYTFQIFADYHLVFLQDEAILKNGLDISDSITDQTCKDMLALEQGTICIMPVRNMSVPIEVEICNSPPIDKLDEWDQVVDCGIEIPSGKIVIYGATDNTSKSPRVTLPQGSYKVRIYYGGLNTLNPSGTEGADHYKAVFWPGKSTEVQFIKRYKK